MMFPTREEWQVAHQALTSRRMGTSEQERQEVRQRWASLTAEEKRQGLLFGFGLWLVTLGVVLLEAIHGPFCL